MSNETNDDDRCSCAIPSCRRRIFPSQVQLYDSQETVFLSLLPTNDMMDFILPSSMVEALISVCQSSKETNNNKTASQTQRLAFSSWKRRRSASFFHGGSSHFLNSNTFVRHIKEQFVLLKHSFVFIFFPNMLDT